MVVVHKNHGVKEAHLSVSVQKGFGR